MIIDLMEINFSRINKYTKGNFFHINIGTGKDYKISEIAQIIKKISNFKGKIIYNKNYPDGVKRKVMNINLLKKISPKSINDKIISKQNLIQKIRMVYEDVNEGQFKKNSSYSLPI